MTIRTRQERESSGATCDAVDANKPESRCSPGVDPQLITAIIAIESGGNPNAVSKSNAIGLMQLKASTSGRDVYRRMGWSGEPTTSETENPERNISMGRLT